MRKCRILVFFVCTICKHVLFSIHTYYNADQIRPYYWTPLYRFIDRDDVYNQKPCCTFVTCAARYILYCTPNKAWKTVYRGINGLTPKLFNKRGFMTVELNTSFVLHHRKPVINNLEHICMLRPLANISFSVLYVLLTTTNKLKLIYHENRKAWEIWGQQKLLRMWAGKVKKIPKRKIKTRKISWEQCAFAGKMEDGKGRTWIYNRFWTNILMLIAKSNERLQSK